MRTALTTSNLLLMVIQKTRRRFHPMVDLSFSRLCEVACLISGESIATAAILNRLLTEILQTLIQPVHRTANGSRLSRCVPERLKRDPLAVRCTGWIKV